MSGPAANARPILFVCENNGYAATTASGAMSAGEGPTARARSLSIVTADVDGNDVCEVDEVAAAMVREVRSGALFWAAQSMYSAAVTDNSKDALTIDAALPAFVYG